MRFSIRNFAVATVVAGALGVTSFTAPTAMATTAPLAVTSAANNIYVAFGDSVPAGYSASPTLDDSPNAAPCARSNINYPRLAEPSLGLPVYNLACSGATVPAGLTGPQTVSYGNPVQTVTISSQIAQAKSLKLAGKRIRLATVTIGANDLGWSAWLGLCVNPTTNCATDANTAAFNAQLAKMNKELLKALQQLCDLDINKILLTGYYDPMGSLAGTAYPLTSAEVTWYQARLKSVNDLLYKDTKQFSHTRFLRFDNVLNAAAGDVIPLTLPGGGHPTDPGQRKLAAALVNSRS